MAMIKCKECNKEVSNQADKCPNCGAPIKKSIGCLTLAIFIFVGITIFGIVMEELTSNRHSQSSVPSVTTPNLEYNLSQDDLKAAQQLPTYKVIGKDFTSFAILVSPTTTDDQLTLLINQFRKARTENTFSTMIPPTTPGGAKGDYFGVWVFVFTESEWASTDRLKKFISASITSKSDMKYSGEYAQHIRAEYFYYQGQSEYGTIGYEDEFPHYRSKNFKKLF
jgi:hypothetical protein